MRNEEMRLRRVYTSYKLVPCMYGFLREIMAVL